MLTPLTEYAGFWRRVIATLVDMLWISLLVMLLLYLTYGNDFSTLPSDFNVLTFWTQIEWRVFLLADLLPTALVLFFWIRYAATPGKLLLDCEIVDARSGEPISPQQALLRYFSYLIYLLPITLAMFLLECDIQVINFLNLDENLVVMVCSIAAWIAMLPMFGLFRIIWDQRKQGWHDKIAGTVVIIHDEATVPLPQLDKNYH